MTASSSARQGGRTVALLGAGAVGARAARQLSETPGIATVLVLDRDPKRSRAVAEAIGPSALTLAYRDGDDLPEGVDAIACAIPADGADDVLRAAIAAGVPIASSAEPPELPEDLEAVATAARRAAVPVLAGCGLAPGLVDVLAAHAAGTFDVVEEIFAARVGTAGPASLSALRRARRERPSEVRDGELEEPRRAGEELVWFPDPIGAHPCLPVASGVRLLAAAFPSADRIGVRFGEEPDRRWWQRADPAGPWGAARVEVWGRRGPERETLVYGVVERTAVAAGTVLALATAALLGVVAGVAEIPAGLHGLGVIDEPRAFIAELARRGVKVAVFEGLAKT